MEGIFKSFLIKDCVLFELKKILKDLRVNESRGSPLFNWTSISGSFLEILKWKKVSIIKNKESRNKGVLIKDKLRELLKMESRI